MIWKLKNKIKLLIKRILYQDQIKMIKSQVRKNQDLLKNKAGLLNNDQKRIHLRFLIKCLMKNKKTKNMILQLTICVNIIEKWWTQFIQKVQEVKGLTSN